MDSLSQPDSKMDSVARLREYVREHKRQRGEVDTDEIKENNDNDAVNSAIPRDTDTGGISNCKHQREEEFDNVDKTSDKDVKSLSVSVSNESPKPPHLSNSSLRNTIKTCSSSSDSQADTNVKPTLKSKRLSNAAKQFMDNKSLSSSSSTNSFVADNGRRPSFFIESSKVSLSSDDEEEPLPLLMELILSGKDQDDQSIYGDWDSGLSHSSFEIHPEDSNSIDDESWIQGSRFNPDHVGNVLHFPHRPLRHMECHICLEMDYLRRRVCCDFQICNQCLFMYLSGKVTDGKVQIECANDRCNALMYKDEILFRLPIDLREKFTRFLINANQDPHIKTCPSCSLPYEIDPERLNVSKKQLKHGVEVYCSKCRLVWCFRCQAPFHTNVTCKKYKSEDEMVKRWAKGKAINGQVNAQKCPKCKIFVQKRDGCDHMKCTQCKTDFCYKCGDRYISVKFFGSHWNRFSLFGCKYRLMPQKNGLRRFIRGSHFVGRVLAAIIFAGLGVAAGAVLVAGSVVILPGYGIFVLKRRLWAAKQRKKFDRVRMRMISVAEKQRALMEKQNGNNLTTVAEESETETVEQIPDPQQIQVVVHQLEESLGMAGNTDRDRDGDIIVNKYVTDVDMPKAQPPVAKHETSFVEDGGATATLTERYFELDDIDERIYVSPYSSSSPDDENVIEEETVDSGVICDDSNSKHLLKEESIASECECESTCTSKCVKTKDERKPHRTDLTSLQSLSITDDNNAAGDVSSMNESIGDNNEVYADDHQCSTDLQKSQSLSLSRESSNISEKIIMKNKTLKTDTDNKIPIPFKADGENENGGKGCFGNIFNVSKRTGVLSTAGNHLNTNINEEDNTLKMNKDKSRNVNMKKAATWEKCRRAKLGIDSSWNNKSSITDTEETNLANNASLAAALKSSSSFSSLNNHSYRSRYAEDDATTTATTNATNILLQECADDSNSKHCIDSNSSSNVNGNDTPWTQYSIPDDVDDDDDEYANINRINCEPPSVEDSSHPLPYYVVHDSDQTLITHL